MQKRLPQELRLAGITDMVEANRFLKEVCRETPTGHNARFATPAEDRGTAFVPFTGALDDILCIHEDTHRLKRQRRCTSYKRLARRRKIPAGGATTAITSRPGSASTNTPTAQWPSSMDRDVWRDITPMANRSISQTREGAGVTRFDATDRLSNLWTSGQPLRDRLASPQGQKPQQKRS